MLYIILAVAVGGFLVWRTKKRVKTVVPPKKRGSGGQAGKRSDTEI